MPQAGFNPLKRSATQVLKLSQHSTSKALQLDYSITYFHWNILTLAGFEPGTSLAPSKYVTN